MFHNRYQKLSHLSWGEKRHLINALKERGRGLSKDVEDAMKNYLREYVQGPFVPHPEERLLGSRKPSFVSAYDRANLQVAVEALEAAHRREPMTVYALMLASYYLYLERYAEAVEVLKQAISVTPTDVRLVCALATVYRALGRPRSAEAERMYAPAVLEGSADPVAQRLVASATIEDACSRVGLTADDARRLAVDHFSKVLEMNVHPSERKSVEESLQIMREMLQGRVRAQRKLQPTEEEAVEGAAREYLDDIEWTEENASRGVLWESLRHPELASLTGMSFHSWFSGHTSADSLTREIFMYGLMAGHRMAHGGLPEDTPELRAEIAKRHQESDRSVIEQWAREYREALLREESIAGCTMDDLVDREIQANPKAAAYLHSWSRRLEPTLQTFRSATQEAQASEVGETFSELWIELFAAGMLAGMGRYSEDVYTRE